MEKQVVIKGAKKKLFVQIGYKYTDNILTVQENIIYF
jgi:hypothetical protein